MPVFAVFSRTGLCLPSKSFLVARCFEGSWGGICTSGKNATCPSERLARGIPPWVLDIYLSLVLAEKAEATIPPHLFPGASLVA